MKLTFLWNEVKELKIQVGKAKNSEFFIWITAKGAPESGSCPNQSSIIEKSNRIAGGQLKTGGMRIDKDNVFNGVFWKNKIGGDCWRKREGGMGITHKI